MVAWWTGDGSSLDVVGGNNGVLEGGAVFAAGKVGQAFSLDGIDDRIRVPNSAAMHLAQGFSIEAWILPKSASGNHVIVSKWSDITSEHSYIFKEHSAGSLRIELHDKTTRFADLSKSTSITVGQWTHVAVTYDRLTLKLFADGTQAASIDVDPNRLLGLSTADVLIGATANGVAENFNGLIDEVSLYNRALSPAEIQSIYAANADGKIKATAMTVTASHPAPGSTLSQPPTVFAIDFSFAYDVASVQSSRFTVNGRAADSFIATDADTITFRFNQSPVTVAGTQTMALAAGALTASVAGVGIPSLAAWTANFRAPEGQPLANFDSRTVDLTPGSGSSFIPGVQVVNDTAYFYSRAQNESTDSLWKTDGTAAGTSKVVNGPNSSQFGETTTANGNWFFFANSGSFQLWKIDATSGSPSLIHDSVNGSLFHPFFLGNAGSTLFYVARSQQLGDQLWRSDGTTAGTFMLSDVNPGGRIFRKDDILVKKGVILNDRLYFIADSDSTAGYELWVSDGTPQGTGKLFGSDPAAPFPFVSSSLFALNGHVYFRGRDGADRSGLWRTDGSVAGTSLFNEQAAPIATAMERMFFSTSTGLWATDGTAGGTVFLKGVTVTSTLVHVNGTVFFAANDGVGNAL
jgi:ELWxxDGT repeat protein